MFEQQLPRFGPGGHQAAAHESRDHLGGLRTLLLGDRPSLLELPALPDLVAALTALARGSRHKAVVALASTPAEFALVRSANKVVVDCYSTESAPEVFMRGRHVSLQALLDACAAACEEASLDLGEGPLAGSMSRLSRRVAELAVSPDPHASFALVTCTGGSLESPGGSVSLAFGFSAEIAPSVDSAPEALAFADVHALLFRGRLWAFSAGRRFDVYEGNILLAAQRMVTAVRALCEAAQADKPLHVRLLSGSFSVALRRDLSGRVALTLSGRPGHHTTWPELDLASAALPILRLASDLVRRLIATDRRQSHNLRVTALRAELRALRRMIRARNRLDGFENRDPERLRLSQFDRAASKPSVQRDLDARVGAMRYTERWSAEVDGLDASAFHLCGDRLVIVSQKLTLAVARGTGELLWSQPTAGAASMMAGQTLLRVLPDGELELCEVQDGMPYARAQIAPRARGLVEGLFAGGGDLPPVVVLAEARRRIVAVDLRTGEPRWRFRVRGHGRVQLVRAGRVLLVAGGDGALDALDVTSGEVVWRFGARARFCLKPALCQDVVVAVSGEPGGGSGAVYGIDLYTGRCLWSAELPAAPSTDPIAAGDLAVIPCGRSRQAELVAFEAATGARVWAVSDPGLDNGAQAMSLDRGLLINTPSGRVLSLGLSDGSTRWARSLANPLTDDVPRQLMPLLRQGALFVPSAQIHILRPKDGAALTEVRCDLVPDCLRVDERGWFYVAEESGHVRAFAAAPQLSLVKGRD